MESKTGAEGSRETKVERGVMLVCVDGSRTSSLLAVCGYSSKALDVALRVSRSDEYYRIVALHVSDPEKPHLPAHFSPDFLQFQLERKLVMAGRKTGSVRVVPKLDGSVQRVIAQVAEEEHATLLVMGEFGRKGASVWGTGSNTDWTLRCMSQSPIIVKTRSDAMDDDKRVYRFMACVDGSEPRSTSVVRSIARFVRPGKDSLTILHVRHPDNVHFAGHRFGNTEGATFVRKSYQRQRAKGVDFEVDLSDESKTGYVDVLRDMGITPIVEVQPQRAGMGIAQHICTVAQELEIDVMAVGEDGQTAAAAGKKVAGSTADAVAKRCRTTVFIVKDV